MGEELGPASEEDLQAVIDWLTAYNIGEYVGSGYEEKLDGVAENLIWKEYMSGVDGDFVFNGFEPTNFESDWVPQGYYVGTIPWVDEAKSITIWTFASEPCVCDGDEECGACQGNGSLDYDLVEIARGVSSTKSQNPEQQPSPKFCQECGNQRAVQAKFCTHCGFKF
jgi:hypothetical protein